MIGATMPVTILLPPDNSDLEINARKQRYYGVREATQLMLQRMVGEHMVSWKGPT